MDKNTAKTNYIDQFWDAEILPSLIEYIRIPNKSPQFDAEWQQHGHMDKAVKLIADWCNKHAVPGMTLDVIQIENKTPVILMEIPGNTDDTILLYGHLDKQPEMTGWDDDLGPWTPVLRDNKLYGRGAADDGYAAYASLTAIKSLVNRNIPHPRCVILIEASEESGSPDLPFYIDQLQDRIGKPKLIVCLDSGCGNYDQLWMTTSLRGLVGGTITIETLKQGIHSGSGSGIAPSCIRILRQILNRIEDESTGNVLLKELYTTIPESRVSQAKTAADILGKSIFSELPFHDKVKAESDDLAELILRRTWKPALSIIGCDGIPNVANAGNVTLPKISVKISMRLPPTINPDDAAQALKKVIEENPPYDAKINFKIDDHGPGWNAPEFAPWLFQAASDASKAHFERDCAYMGEGGSIPFMGMLGKKFPNAQFVITGLLGPGSNAHGPNEFLHIPTAKKLTACIADIIEKTTVAVSQSDDDKNN